MANKKPAAPQSSPLPLPAVVGVGYDKESGWPVFRLRDMNGLSAEEVEVARSEIERRVNQGPAFDAAVDKSINLMERIRQHQHSHWCDTPDDSRGQAELCRELSETIAALKLAQEAK